jgi:hypothetical protein
MGFNMKKNRATKLKANKGFSVVLFKTLKWFNMIYTRQRGI